MKCRIKQRKKEEEEQKTLYSRKNLEIKNIKNIKIVKKIKTNERKS